MPTVAVVSNKIALGEFIHLFEVSDINGRRVYLYLLIVVLHVYDNNSRCYV